MSPRVGPVVTGPLVAHAEGLSAALTAGGYAPCMRVKYDALLVELSGWLAAQVIDPVDCNEEVVRDFAEARRAAGRTVAVTVAGLGPLLGYLRGVAAIPPAPPAEPDPNAQVLATYRRYLEQERRLAPLTVSTAIGVVGRFLRARAVSTEEELSRLAVGEVHAFVLAEADRLSIGATRATLGALRPFLRYLFATGVLARDLSVTIPGVAGARLSSLPRGLDAATVAVLMGSCVRPSVVGRRDFAILTLQVRLGLRANEITAMRLDDIDWRAGELTVRGKGGRVERLPLPADVGEALVDYLRHGRGRSTNRAVFLRVMAPSGPMSRNAVVMVSRTASRRAGIPVVGAHRLRHTAATEMLRAGASLREVGQVLRHADDATTAIYAKVDLGSLELVVSDWPEETR
jgi:integrase/recombinase XerD